tara:strand:- start:2056 stop:2376 length:321 start_codon:yes stop_codon:yes gene_type:complete
MSKVYIPNDSGQDFTPAEIFGTLVPLTVGTQNRWNLRGHYHTFMQELSDSSPDDFLVVVGLATQIAVATGILAKMHGQVNYLLFDGKHSYRDYTLVFDEVVPETTS